MAQIKVILRDHTGAKQIPVELPDDVPMGQLIPALVPKLGLPSSRYLYPEFAGEKLRMPVYALSHHKIERLLGDTDDDTLASIGIQEGDTLTLIPGNLLWERSVEEAMTFVSGKTFRETAVAIALQVGEEVTAMVVPKNLPIDGLFEFIGIELGFHPDRRARPGNVDAYLSDAYLLQNETTSTAIDTHSDATVGEVICTGDWVSVRPRLPDQPSSAEDVDRGLLDRIKIHAGDEE